MMKGVMVHFVALRYDAVPTGFLGARCETT